MFTTLETYARHALVLAEPITGRMHQIRLHLAYLQAPIVGDVMYGGEDFYLSSLKKKFNLKEGQTEQPFIKRFAAARVAPAVCGPEGRGNSGGGALSEGFSGAKRRATPKPVAAPLPGGRLAGGYICVLFYYPSPRPIRFYEATSEEINQKSALCLHQKPAVRPRHAGGCWPACYTPRANCVDVGCHKGEVLDQMLRYAPNGQHFGFEPIPDLFQGLETRYAGRPNCHFYQLGLSDAPGEVSFNYVVSNPAYSGFVKRKYDRAHEEDTLITVRKERLDEVLPPGTRISLIKIDVEGAELEVLRGATRLIAESRPHYRVRGTDWGRRTTTAPAQSKYLTC